MGSESIFWTALLITALALLGGSGLRWLIKEALRPLRRADDHQEPPARVQPPQPAPGQNPPQPGQAGIHRGPIMRIDMWACGCMWIYTPETGWVREIDCLDEQLRRLLTKPRGCPACGGIWCHPWCNYAKDTES